MRTLTRLECGLLSSSAGGWSLGKARVGDGDLPLIDGKRPFYQSSPGTILRTLILKQKTAGRRRASRSADLLAHATRPATPGARSPPSTIRPACRSSAFLRTSSSRACATTGWKAIPSTCSNPKPTIGPPRDRHEPRPGPRCRHRGPHQLHPRRTHHKRTPHR